VKIDRSSQSLILPGESFEADRRFEQAVRLNGTRPAAEFALATPPAAAETLDTGGPGVLAFASTFTTEAGHRDMSSAPSGPMRSKPRRWEELYRMVTSDNSLRKGRKLDAVA
jgi:hypothetical protein